MAFIASSCFYSCTCSCPSFSFLRVPVHLIHRISYSTGPTPYPCTCAYPCACTCAYSYYEPGAYYTSFSLPGSWLPAAVPGISPWALGHWHVPCTCSQHLHPCLNRSDTSTCYRKRNALLVHVRVLYSQQLGRPACGGMSDCDF